MPILRTPVPASTLAENRRRYELSRGVPQPVIVVKKKRKLTKKFPSPTKYYDIVPVTQKIQSDGVGATYTSVLSGITQGDTEQQLDGNQLVIKSVLIRCGLTIDNVANAKDTIRLMLVEDRGSPQGLFPNMTDFFGAGYTIHSPLNMTNNRGRWKVHFDKYISISQISKPQVEFKKFIRLNSLVSLTSAQLPVKGGLYFVQLGTNTTASGVGTNQLLYIRTRFKE